VHFKGDAADLAVEVDRNDRNLSSMVLASVLIDAIFNTYYAQFTTFEQLWPAFQHVNTVMAKSKLLRRAMHTGIA
jgi:hypothetical protein